MNIQKIFSALISIASIAGSVLLLVGETLAGTTLWIIGYLVVLFRQFRVFRDLEWKQFPNMQVLTRLCFTVGVAGPLLNFDHSAPFLSWVAFALALFYVRLPRVIPEIATGADFEVANLPGVVLAQYPKKIVSTATLMLLFLPPTLLLLALIQAPGYLLFSVTAIIGIILFLGIAQSLRWKSSRENLGPVITKALESHEPKFAVHWSAPENSGYQLSMWIPYLNALQIPYFIIVRNSRTWDEALSISASIPLIRTRTLHQAEEVLVPSLTTLLYVNNADRNSHMVRHSHLKHIQLLHGDSEKASSYNPVTAMYDRIYVAGEAGIDRYLENGVDIPHRKFSIIGRPQVSKVLSDTKPISEKKTPTVLYAPTWNGFFKDTAYSSLPIVDPLIQILLSRGVRIIFRPHPYTSQDQDLDSYVQAINYSLKLDKQKNGIQHIWGEQASFDMSVYECFNQADALIADVSSVITDFLFSEKPIGIMTGQASRAEVIGSWKLAEAAYVFSNEPEHWDSQVDRMFKEDPLRAKRQEMRTYYLGDIPESHYVERFIATAREDILFSQKLKHGE